MPNYWDRYKGKVVPLDILVHYIFDQHEHYESINEGSPVVFSMPLEKFVIENAEEVDAAYEYAVKRENTVRPDKSYILGDFWTDKEDREDFLEQLTRVLPESVTYKLVKRRKAGPVEDV